MAVLTVEELAAGGGVPTFVAAAAGGDEAPVGAGHFLIVKNDSAGAVTATFRIPVAVGAVVELLDESIAAGAELWVPIPQRDQSAHPGATISRDPDDNATITYSAVTSVTVAAVRAP